MVIQNKIVVIASSVLATTCAILIILLVYLFRVYRQKCAKDYHPLTVVKHPIIPPFIPFPKPDYPQPSTRDESRDKTITDKLDPDKYGCPWTQFYNSSGKSISMDNLNTPGTPSPTGNIKRRQRKWKSTFHSKIGTPSKVRRPRSSSEPYPRDKESPMTSSSESILNVDSDQKGGENQQLIPNDTMSNELPPLGEILVALCHNPSEGKLTVTIKSAKDLPPVTKYGKINPFMIIHVYTSGERIYKKKTTIQHDTKTPNYEESFDFVVTRDKMLQTSVVLRLYHHGHRANIMTKNTPIGVVFMGYQFDLYGPHEYKLDIGARHWASVIEKPLLTIEEWHPVQAFFCV